jgi:hypothetical protein
LQHHLVFRGPAFPARPVREPRYFRASLGHDPRRWRTEDEEAGPAWIDRSLKMRRSARDRTPFPPFTGGYRRQAAKELAAPRSHERIWWRAQRFYPGGRRKRAWQGLFGHGLAPSRATAPNCHTIRVVKERPAGANKKPRSARTDQGFSSTGRFVCADLPAMCGKVNAWVHRYRWTRANRRPRASSRSLPHSCARVSTASPWDIPGKYVPPRRVISVARRV